MGKGLLSQCERDEQQQQQQQQQQLNSLRLFSQVTAAEEEEEEEELEEEVTEPFQETPRSQRLYGQVLDSRELQGLTQSQSPLRTV